jgi:hypothetical protein
LKGRTSPLSGESATNIPKTTLAANEALEIKAAEIGA